MQRGSPHSLNCTTDRARDRSTRHHSPAVRPDERRCCRRHPPQHL